MAQSQPNDAGRTNVAGEPRLQPQPDRAPPAGPSDTETAHAPEEGGAVRDPREAGKGRVDQNHADAQGRSKDLRGDALTGRGVGETGERKD